MDLNYLLHRQQVERIRADNASCEEARRAHAQLARLYENAIQRLTKGNLSFPGGPKYMHAENWSNELRRLIDGCASEVRMTWRADSPPRPDLVPS